MENFNLMPVVIGGQILTRDQLKRVLGGNESLEEVGGHGMMCCYTNPTGCSACDTRATPENAHCPVYYGSQGVLTPC